jgi:hypothetical protein
MGKKIPIPELAILGANGHNDAVFSDKIKYVIPLYQRDFTWEDKEISQLIEDINDFDFKNNHYYIGSLIVDKKGENQYEVIDGQQRLTALFLLLNSLKERGGEDIKIKEDTLTFECRKKSNETLKNINALKPLNDEDIEKSLQNGKSIVDDFIDRMDFKTDHKFINNFLLQLKRVRLFRIKVPKHTDLNHYFEIMNTRGEPLEQHEILKAYLMSKIKAENRRALFAKIWDACSDMTGYVQMRFPASKGEEPPSREELFGKQWNEPLFEEFLNKQWDEPPIPFSGENVNNGENAGGAKIQAIIKPDFKVNDADGATEKKEERPRFDSIISFPFFLLHTLQVLIAGKNISHNISIGDTLNDIKLTDTFKSVISCGMIDGKNIAALGKEWFSLHFIECLLKCRFLFDQYIIKRNFAENSDDEDGEDGEWSLKQLEAPNQKESYKNTDFGQSDETEINSSLKHKKILMLQSCLRVSYTSPKQMRWITTLLKWLYIDGGKNLSNLTEYDTEIEKIATYAVTEEYLSKIPEGPYNKGTATPHIVFNYLDYLLWKVNPKKHPKFRFKFRNSVEHWYPQHPNPEEGLDYWKPEEGLDDFGNLCIIHRHINSKFSNFKPLTKADEYEKTIEKQSLKLKIMAKMTKRVSEADANKNWKDKVCQKHEKAMINKLKKECNKLLV